MPISFTAATGLLNGATRSRQRRQRLLDDAERRQHQRDDSGRRRAELDNADGSFTFTPPPGVTGHVTFTYQVQDTGCPGIATSAAATVTVNVSGHDDLVRRRQQRGRQRRAGRAVPDDRAGRRRWTPPAIVSSSTTAPTRRGRRSASEWLIGQAATGANFDTVMAISPPAGTMARPSINGAAPVLQSTVTAATTPSSTGIAI